MAKATEQKLVVALAGNPNVGKSTLFNTFTGLHQHTGNWPGKTVSRVKGTLTHQGTVYEFVDLPGTYSLDGNSQDERIAAEYIRSGKADCVVVVCDGSCLERNLILALQILEQAARVVICVNLVDEAQRRGFCLNRELLEKRLGAPVVFTSASQKRGLEELLGQILRMAKENGTERPCAACGHCIHQAQCIASECVTRREDAPEDRQRKIDRLLVSRRLGIPILLLLLLLIVWLTVWGANYPSALLEEGFAWLYVRLKIGLQFLPEWLSGILIDGIYATSARVISVMLPPMAIFFPLFTILEDVGYLPRVAFLLDRGMSRCGGCGKQALTMCMGLGCNAVGVTGCRIIDSPREQLLAILTNAMIPCNGRFPTLILLGSLFFPQVGAAFVVALCVVLGITGAMGTSALLSRRALRGVKSTFLMEMPPFRKPRVGQIFIRSLLDRTLFVAGRALTVAAPTGLLLWLMGRFSLLELSASFLNPVGRLLGMNGVILLGFLLSLPANELLIPVILMTVSGTHSLQSVAAMDAGLLQSTGFTWQMALCTMVFTLFHWPCSTTLLTIRKETGSVKKTAAAFFLPTAVGFAICIVLNLLLSLIFR